MTPGRKYRQQLDLRQSASFPSSDCHPWGIPSEDAPTFTGGLAPPLGGPGHQRASPKEALRTLRLEDLDDEAQKVGANPPPDLTPTGTRCLGGNLREKPKPEHGGGQHDIDHGAVPMAEVQCGFGGRDPGTGEPENG